MTLDEAVAAVEQTFSPTAHLRVDRARARESADSFLLIVLDTRGVQGEADGSGENGPRLVDRASGRVERLTVRDALALSSRMRSCSAPTGP